MVRVPKRVKVPAAALDRLVRKRLATDRADARRLVRGVKPGRKRVDLLKTLRAAARTSAARGALADLPAADLPLLVLAIADQEGARSAGLDAGLQALASCGEGAADARAERAEVAGRQGRADCRARCWIVPNHVGSSGPPWRLRAAKPLSPKEDTG